MKIKQQISSVNAGILKKLQSLSDIVRNTQDKRLALPPTANHANRWAHLMNCAVNQTLQGTVSGVTDTVIREINLLVGDSLLKGIHPSGLTNKVDLDKISGAKVKDIDRRIDNIDKNIYSDVIVHVGGNDVSDGKSYETACRELRDVTVLVLIK